MMQPPGSRPGMGSVLADSFDPEKAARSRLSRDPARYPDATSRELEVRPTEVRYVVARRCQPDEGSYPWAEPSPRGAASSTPEVSSASILSAASRCNEGRTCEYVFKVRLICE